MMLAKFVGSWTLSQLCDPIPQPYLYHFHKSCSGACHKAHGKHSDMSSGWNIVGCIPKNHGNWVVASHVVTGRAGAAEMVSSGAENMEMSVQLRTRKASWFYPVCSTLRAAWITNYLNDKMSVAIDHFCGHEFGYQAWCSPELVLQPVVTASRDLCSFSKNVLQVGRI